MLILACKVTVFALVVVLERDITSGDKLSFIRDVSITVGSSRNRANTALNVGRKRRHLAVASTHVLSIGKADRVISFLIGTSIRVYVHLVV